MESILSSTSTEAHPLDPLQGIESSLLLKPATQAQSEDFVTRQCLELMESILSSASTEAHPVDPLQGIESSFLLKPATQAQFQDFVNRQRLELMESVLSSASTEAHPVDPFHGIESSFLLKPPTNAHLQDSGTCHRLDSMESILSSASTETHSEDPLEGFVIRQRLDSNMSSESSTSMEGLPAAKKTKYDATVFIPSGTATPHRVITAIVAPHASPISMVQPEPHLQLPTYYGNYKRKWSAVTHPNGQPIPPPHDSIPQPCSYLGLIILALKNSRNGFLPIPEIYNFVATVFRPFVAMKRGQACRNSGWQNCIRHCLSAKYNKDFFRVSSYRLTALGVQWGRRRPLCG
jgi:hypothetical protein